MLISTTIRIGKQAVELITNENRVILELEKIKHDLTLFEKVQDPRTKRFHNVPKASYYLYEEYDSHYKMVVSINSLRLITDAIRRANVQHKVKIEKIDYKIHRSNLTLKSEYQAREEQEKFIKALIEENDIPSYLLDLQPGYGKAEWVENKIRIPNGWKRMGDIVVGDEVIAKDGTTTKVTGVYPQGLKQEYRVYFIDGRYITCCGEHLWGVYIDGEYQIMNTYDIMYKQLKNHKEVYIELIDSEQNEDKVFPRNPYEVGNDKCLFIDHYLDGSTRQRLELLRGLEENKFLYFTSIENNPFYNKSLIINSEHIANKIRLLIYSLGGICNIETFDSFAGMNNITDSNPIGEPFYKKDFLIMYSFPNSKKLRITQIMKMTTEVEMQCISIEHPDKLYVTQDYVVTHNTMIGYHSCVRLRQKFMILVKPTFLEKWVEDVKKYSDLEDGSLFVIKGRDSLIKLFDMSREEVKKIDVFVTSMRTITNYHYLCFTENYYKVKPENFLSYTGITNVLNDESHKEFEALFKIIMWLNPYKLFGLSATMESNKPGVNDFYNLIYPKLNRLNSIFGLNRYLTLYFVNYKIAHGVNLPHKTFRGYNHIMYEQAIMKNMHVLNDYIDMMIEMLEIYYIDYKSKVDYGFDRPKCLFFFSTVDMCTIVTNKFKSIYKDYKVYRYTGDDDYQEMLESDIIISTPGSTGTGIDIPGLITAIQTVSIGDHQLNIQAAGRLREIKGKDVLYVCLQAENIAKQQQLKMKRLNSLRDRVKVIKYEKYSKYIGLKGAPNNAKANTDKKVFKTPYFGKKNFYKSPYSKGGNKNSFGYNKFRK